MKRFLYAGVALIVFLSGLAIGQYTPVKEALAQMCGGPGNCDFVGNMVVHGNLTVADGNDFISGDDFTSVDDMTVGDDLTVTDDATFTDDIIASGDIGPTRQTTITVTSGGTITPLGAYVPLSSAGAVGTATIAGCTAGATTGSKLVLLENVGAQTITLTDTGTLKLTANIALGAFDTLTLLCDTGSGNWVQFSTANN